MAASATSSVKKVLLVYKHYAPDTGGIETAVKQYVQWYQAMGHEVTVLCCATSGSATRHERIDGVRVIRCGSWGHLKSVPLSPAFFWHYWRETRTADLVHVNLQFPWASMGYWLFGRTRSCRWLVSYHMDVHRQKCLKRLTYPFDRYLLTRADQVITGSPKLREHSEMLSAIERDIAILPYVLEGGCVEAALAPTAPAREAEQELPAPGYFVFFGRLVEYKGTRPMAAAMRRLAVEAPGIRFVVFGRGPEQGAFDRLATEFPEQVTVIPEFVSEHCKYQLIARSAAVLFPSVYPSEAFGIAQLEAMACAKPIINCWLNSGVNWVAPDKECAITVVPHDVEALVAAIQKLDSDPEYRRLLGDAARERFLKQFSEPVVAEHFQHLVSRLLGSNSQVTCVG
ncbi:glycosyltransferase [Billgrantia kenyensis]|uniref:Glycosyltransferase n=1 Tax=Billgrantia kenyensis TaxID=321266 RepID=A0A7V9W0V3_9GAMM|nr:glycosyltransferase [Halomonas kenyensis]MBA2778998.1 glycosyltransferase [Halomonas kenyensis]MCG6662925.1 glycosyltransferase [Halomonas kenyensis]